MDLCRLLMIQDLHDNTIHDLCVVGKLAVLLRTSSTIKIRVNVSSFGSGSRQFVAQVQTGRSGPSSVLNVDRSGRVRGR